MDMPWIKVNVDDDNIQHMAIGVGDVSITFSAPKDCTQEEITTLSNLIDNANMLFEAGLVQSMV